MEHYSLTWMSERHHVSADHYLATIVESSDDAILSKDLNGIVQSCNPATERIFGYTASELIGRPVRMLIPPERQSEEDDILARIRRGERVEHYETVRLTKDQRRIDVSLTISPLRDADGVVVGASKIVRDVTERRRQERERLDGERRKDEFFAVLAHELRGPLAPILTAVTLLQKQTPAEPHLQRLADTILRQTLQLSKLVDDLFDVGRIAAGKLHLERSRVDLLDVVRQAVEASSALIERRGHTLSVQLPDRPVHLVGDRTRLVQVTSNLLNNAAKYTPNGGRIELVVREESGAGVVSVRDQGVGIPVEMLDRIFDRFVQVAPPDQRSEGGLGIGLSVVKALVELHAGTVEARSAGVGKGSEFTFRVPLAAT